MAQSPMAQSPMAQSSTGPPVAAPASTAARVAAPAGFSRVVAVADDSPAALAGVAAGDEIVAVNGQVPRDVIAYSLLIDGPEIDLALRRGGTERVVTVRKQDGEPLGVEVSSALFDQVRTCDNHCEFCFIYQLPKGLRRSLYLKDDDYRLSFLYGNFTTLTRFTEADLERVVTERLGPLFVSIHSTDPELRARMLRNRRGATSLRWLRALLDHGVEVHGQIVVCPGVNDGGELERTLAGLLDRYPEVASVAVVPLGVSRYSKAGSLRLHTKHEADAVIGCVTSWQEVFARSVGRRSVHAGDEYYLMAGRPFPPLEAYEGFAQHENGVGMARAFIESFGGARQAAIGARPGFFAWVDGAPAEGYRARRAPTHGKYPGDGTVSILTGSYGRQVLEPLVRSSGLTGVRVLEVPNRFFGGNIGVSGLMVGEDVSAILDREPEGGRYWLPDCCLSDGLFLDGMPVEALPRPVEVLPSDGLSLRTALRAARGPW